MDSVGPFIFATFLRFSSIFFRKEFSVFGQYNLFSDELFRSVNCNHNYLCQSLQFVSFASGSNPPTEVEKKVFKAPCKYYLWYLVGTCGNPQALYSFTLVLVFFSLLSPDPHSISLSLVKLFLDALFFSY